MVRVFLFGDSITAGQGVSVEKTWPVLLAGRMTGKANIQVRAKNGDTTQLALERLHYDVLSQPMDYVFIQFGINDCNRWKTLLNERRVNPSSFKGNLIQMVTLVRKYGGVPVLTINPVCGIIHDRLEYNTLIREVAAEQAVMTLDASTLNTHEHFFPDGVHLTEFGNGCYANLAHDLLSTVL